MIFTDEEIQQVLRSDNWSVTKEFKPIAIPISRIISKKTFKSFDMTMRRLERLRRKLGKVPFTTLKYSRNKIRKSKSHFRK